jgi:hypothetical protein
LGTTFVTGGIVTTGTVAFGSVVEVVEVVEDVVVV